MKTLKIGDVVEFTIVENEKIVSVAGEIESITDGKAIINHNGSIYIRFLKHLVPASKEITVLYKMGK